MASFWLLGLPARPGVLGLQLHLSNTDCCPTASSLGVSVLTQLSFLRAPVTWHERPTYSSLTSSSLSTSAHY